MISNSDINLSNSVVQVPSSAQKNRNEYFRSYKRKTTLVTDISDLLNGSNLQKHEISWVLENCAPKLGILDANTSKENKGGMALTKYETRKRVWDFRHQHSFPSTNTTKTARIYCKSVPSLQKDLDFVDSVSKLKKRKIEQYENLCHTTEKPYQSLCNKYNTENFLTPVSYGTFLALKPFYIKPAGVKDIEVCVCKIHLHMRNCVKALVQLPSKLNIPQHFSGYKSFFEFLSQNCPTTENSLYVPWECTLNPSILCDQITDAWNHIKTKFENISSSNQPTVNLLRFEKVEIENKNGSINSKLQPKNTPMNVQKILQFMEKLLPKVTHHRNLLKNYRSSISDILNFEPDPIILDVDFSENLSVPVNMEPQSYHWTGHQLSIHSGISKFRDQKIYQPYISDDLRHDQHFVYATIRMMLEGFDTSLPKITLITISDSCAAQYKSAVHFYHLQKLSTELNLRFIRLYGIPGHGKSEVDNVGGMAKVVVRKEVARGTFFHDAQSVASFLQIKTQNSLYQTNSVKTLPSDVLLQLLEVAKLIREELIERSYLYLNRNNFLHPHFSVSAVVVKRKLANAMILENIHYLTI